MQEPSNKTELKDDVREQTGYTDPATFSPEKLDTALRNAKRRIRTRTNVPRDADWFDPENPEREEALFWYTCLFAKLSRSDLDASSIDAGALSESTLLAKGGDGTTEWYRNARQAVQAMQAGGVFRHTTPQRDGRTYQRSDQGGGGPSL